MKKFLSLMLCLIMVVSVPVMAIPVSAENGFGESGQFELLGNEIEPDEPVDPDDPEPIWGQMTYNVSPGQTLDTSTFQPEEPYMAYEVVSTGDPSSQFSVKLIEGANGLVTNLSGYSSGGMYKMDWIDVEDTETYKFRITNNSSSNSISVVITYYSWDIT